MSFSENLHDCFDMVHQHSVQRRKGATEFIQLMEEKAAVEEAYAKGLEKIGNNQYFVTNQGTLSHAILAMKNDALNKAMQAKILADNILKDLVEPLKDLLRNQAKTLQKTHTEGKKSEKERLTLLEKHERYKIRYTRACKEYEALTFQMETPQIALRREKLMQKMVQNKQEIDESLRGYQDSIAQHNTFKDKFTDFMSKILEVYQRQEEQRLEMMKNCLQKLVVYETSYLRNLQYDIDNLARAMESINIKSDIKQFVDENASPNPINSKLEFQPYEGLHDSFKNLGQEAPVIKMPPAPMQVKFSEITNPAAISEMLKAEVDLIVNKAWEGVEISLGEFQYFASVIKEVPGRKTFLWCVNNKKTQNSFALTEIGFANLVKFFAYVLAECDTYRDFVALKGCVTLMHVFYKDSESKTTVQEALLANPVWKKLEYWESMIYSAISEEIGTQQHYAIEEETKEDKERRAKNIIFCQLGSYAFIMTGFGIDLNIISEIISKHACRYDLSTEDMETLNV